MNETPVTIRIASPDDEMAIRRLAELDTAPPPSGPALLALHGERPVAALSLRDDHAVANPFEPTAQAVSLLRLRATQLVVAPQP